MARERCTELCTRAATGSCGLCEALDKRDAFFAVFLRVWAMLAITIAILGVLLWALTWPFRRWWFRDAALYVIGPTGYRAVVPALAALIAAYVGVYAIVEGRHERQMNRALFEQSRFMTLAASGSPGGLNAALAEYQTLKAREVLKSPDIWRAWTWTETERVNEEALGRWAKRFFAGCPKSWCGQGLDLTVLRSGELQQADLRGAHLQDAILRFAHLQDARLEGAHLQGIILRFANLQKASFGGASLERADLFRANLQETLLEGAHLERANLFRANLQGAFLKNASLERANLFWANLQGARLEGASLKRGDLFRANLQGALLEAASLERANLFRANLQGAILKSAHLERANLFRANLQGAILKSADLRFAKDLATAQIDTAIWDETTMWPDDFIPPCPRQRSIGRCAFLDLLSSNDLLLLALDRFVPRLHDRLPEHSSGLIGQLNEPPR